MGEPNQSLETISLSPAEECAYLGRRAEDHAKMAERAADPATQAIHLRLHQLYKERASLIVVVDTN